MIPDYLLVVLATVLLWLPFPSVSARFKIRATLTRYTQPDLRNVLGNWHNYVDLLRSVIGCYVLFRLPAASLVQPGKLSLDNPLLVWLPEAIVSVGVLIQTVRMLRPLTFTAPIFYLSGIALIVPSFIEAIFALIIAWTFTFGTRDPRFFLPTAGISLALIGFFNSSLTPQLALTTALLLAPLALGVLFNRKLVFLTKEELLAKRFDNSKSDLKPAKSALAPQPAAGMISASNPR